MIHLYCVPARAGMAAPPSASASAEASSCRHPPERHGTGTAMASRRLLGKVACWRRARCHPVRELRGPSGRPGSEWGGANNVPVPIKGSTLPFKAIAGRRHHIPKQRQRATNPAALDATLRWRGGLTVNLAEVGLPGRSGQVRGRDDESPFRQLRRNCRKIGEQAATAIGGHGSLAGWNFRPLLDRSRTS